MLLKYIALPSEPCPPVSPGVFVYALSSSLIPGLPVCGISFKSPPSPPSPPVAPPCEAPVPPAPPAVKVPLLPGPPFIGAGPLKPLVPAAPPFPAGSPAPPPPPAPDRPKSVVLLSDGSLAAPAPPPPPAYPHLITPLLSVSYTHLTLPTKA